MKAKANNKRIRESINTALAIGELGTAKNLSKDLGDKRIIRRVANRLLDSKWYSCASDLFGLLEDRRGIYKIIKKCEQENEAILNFILEDYIGKNTMHQASEAFNEWALKMSYKDAILFPIWEIANMAFNLVGDYDVGVGIARGGLSSAYIFSLFGLDIRIADSHREDRRARFNWGDEVSERDFEGKKVLVFDKDVVSGKTANRALKEIQKYHPTQVDLAVNLNPIREGQVAIGSVLSRVSKGYKDKHYPSKFSYANFPQAIMHLERKLGER